MSDYRLDGYEDLDELSGDRADDLPRRGRRRGLMAGVTVLALAGFAGIVWYAYDSANELVTNGEPPLIRADADPIRIRPDQPGGLQVPHQDRLVLQQIDAAGGQLVIEQILPPPEEPLPRPAPPPQLEPELALNTLPAAALPNIGAPAPTGDIAEESDLRLVPGAPPALPVQPSMAAAAAPVAPAVPEPSPPPVVAAEPPLVAAAPAAPLPDAAPAAGGFRVQMAAVRSQDAAQAEWRRLQSRHPDLLGSLQLQVQQVDLGDRGIYYRVQAGPLSETAADSICSGLKSQKTECIVVAP